MAQFAVDIRVSISAVLKSRVVLVFLALRATLSLLVAQQNSSTPISEQETLRGQTKMSVEVSLSDGITYDKRQLVELLQAHGIHILPDGSYPKLQISIAAVSNNVVLRGGANITEYGIAVVLEFTRLFTADRQIIQASTYSTSTAAVAGVLVANSTIAEVTLTEVKTFLQAFEAVNPNIASPISAQRKLNPFVGQWSGNYTCPGGFVAVGQLRWTIYETSLGETNVKELWSKGISGQVHYMGSQQNGVLNLQEDSNRYRIKATLSEDKGTLNGTYVGHPNRCTTLTLHRDD